MSRVYLILTPLLLFMSLSACTPSSQEEDLPEVVIATLMSHPALDQVREGVLEGLEEEGFQAGVDFTLVERNANGQPQLAPTIASEIVVSEPSLIIAITTPMAQAVKARWSGPLVFGAVTDPIGAGLVENLDGAQNVTGTSDAWPYEDQLALIKEIQPSVRKLGVLYNPGEAASQYGMGQIRKFAPQFGLELVEVPVSSTNEVATAARLAAQTSDALFLSSDNTVISGVAAAFQVSIAEKVPLYVGDSGTVEKGGVAAVSVGYHELGLETGRLAAASLRGERSLPVIMAEGTDTIVNSRAAELMGIQIPQAVLERSTTVIDTIRD